LWGLTVKQLKAGVLSNHFWLQYIPEPYKICRNMESFGGVPLYHMGVLCVYRGKMLTGVNLGGVFVFIVY